MWLINLGLVFLVFNQALASYIAKPKLTDKLNYEEICSNREPNEYFRLSVDNKCSHVYQCSEFGLLSLKCPSGLVFDIEKQQCDWKYKVKNCQQLGKSKLKSSYLFKYKSCGNDKFLCSNGNCINKELFCNNEWDCSDGSDELLCSLGQDPNSASTCNKETCKLPDCYCSQNGTSIPNNLPLENVPQMIMITFDDAVNNNNIDIYNEIFKNDRQNKNNCTIKATFFLSHKYSNYSAVQELHRKGHEIAVHSITHDSNEKYWSNGTIEQWTKEMLGARMIFEKFANITEGSIVGVRAPLLKVGGNNQFEMMEDNKFLYDSSLGAPFSAKPLYPYTLNHRMPHNCLSQKCPTRSHAVWEIPMNEYDRRNDDEESQLSGCVMIDQCTNLVNGELLYNFLNRNFDRHYNSNRAPLGLYFHASWLLNRDFLDSLIQWIDEKLEMEDVYFVTMKQVIDWMKNPVTLSTIKSGKFEPWQNKCLVDDEPECLYPNQCALVTRELPGETNRLHTCMECSRYYPWINNPTGDYDPEE